MRKRRTFVVIVASFALVMASAFVIPWKPWLQQRLISFLESQGLQNVHLTLAGLSTDGMELADVSIGAENPLRLRKITLGYDLQALWSGRVQDISLSGIVFDMKKEGDRWVMSGIDPNGKGSAPLLLPVTPEAIAAVPFDAIKIDDSELHIAFDAGKMKIPVQLTWQKTPTPTLSYEANAIELQTQGANVTTGKFTVTAAFKPESRAWIGQWRINDVKVTEIGQDVPLFKGNGTLAAGETTIMVEGRLANDDASYHSAFRLDYDLAKPDKSRLTLLDSAMPWSGGTLSANDVNVPLQDKQSWRFDLKINKASLASLLKQMTGKDTKSNGEISGSVPVTIAANGNIEVHKGELKADDPGVIAMPPETIPGDNEQVALARTVLENFHYSLLAVDVDQGKNNKPEIMLKIEGRNPDAYDGRAVKLNVRLSGDVLDFFRQNLMILTNPQKLLRQGFDAQN